MAKSAPLGFQVVVNCGPSATATGGCGPHPAAAVALGPQYSAIWDPKGADFAMTLGEFYCAKLDAPVLFDIKREGIVYARVYDLRGRTISSLLSVPGIEQTHY